jgi:predicted nucleic acid-binding protein
MTRYFVDTNILLSLTFHHDRWHHEAKPLHKHNRLYTSEVVIYEYCNIGRGDAPVVKDPADLRSDPRAEDGNYASILADLQENIENNIPFYHQQIDILRIDGLTFEKVVEAFIEQFEFRKQAEEYIWRFFEEYFSTRELTARTAKKAASKLNEDLRKRARQNKQELMDEVAIVESVYDEMTRAREQLEEFVGIGPCRNQIPEDDLLWLLDAIHLCQEGVLTSLVTGDKKDVVKFQDEIQSLFDISVLYTIEEVYTDELAS